MTDAAPPAPDPSSTPVLQPDLGPIGGQALVEGVMMRRGEVWGAAVRCPDGHIATTAAPLPAGLQRWRAIPLVRGVLALFETAALGTKALLWGANERSRHEDGEGFSSAGLALSAVVAITLALGIFGVFPGVVAKLTGVHNPVAFNLIEGVVRLSILLGYLWLLGRNAEVQRTFAYHGAEHMTIHAFEHGVDLEPAAIQQFDRRHPRCGTSFLLLVVAVSVLAHVAVGTPSWGVLVASRILLLPVVAGLAYEAIRFAGLHRHQWFGRALMAPGYWLQGMTTRQPDDDQLVVAVAALRATLAAEAEACAPATIERDGSAATPTELPAAR